MKVYVIMKGEYSDKHICGVTLDPDIAEKIKNLCTGEYDYCEPEVKEFETDIWQFVPKGAKGYRVFFFPDGQIYKINPVENDNDFYEDYGRFPCVGWCWVPGENDVKGLCVSVLALGQAHAKKIACDKRAEYLAMKEGI